MEPGFRTIAMKNSKNKIILLIHVLSSSELYWITYEHSGVPVINRRPFVSTAAVTTNSWPFFVLSIFIYYASTT